MSETAGAVPDQYQEPATQPSSLMWITETQLFELSSATSQDLCY